MTQHQGDSDGEALGSAIIFIGALFSLLAIFTDKTAPLVGGLSAVVLGVVIMAAVSR